jgi:hypothetical protein
MPRFGLYWLKDDSSGELDYERIPPFPSFNAMGNLISSYSKSHLSVSKVEAFFERYEKAQDEIKALFIVERNKVKKLQESVKELEIKLSKWESQQGKGRRPDKKLRERLDEMRSLKLNGDSNRAIARVLGVSEGTVRRMLKEGGDVLNDGIKRERSEP